jgi:hypothetical protein
VVELKHGSFKPEYKGQMELYLPSAKDRGDDANQVLRGSGAGFGKRTRCLCADSESERVFDGAGYEQVPSRMETSDPTISTGPTIPLMSDPVCRSYASRSTEDCYDGKDR